MTILHIVPEHPNKADIALSIANGLQKSHQIDSTFYCLDKLDEYSRILYGFDVINTPLSSLTENTPSSITTVILHVYYATYRALNNKNDSHDFITQLKKTVEQRSLKLITIFHDIPTNRLHSLFIINPLHQSLTKQLAELSTSVITNNTFYQQHLNKNANKNTISVNHFSRVGELKSNNLLGASRCDLVILGGVERADIYKKKSFLKQASEALKINQIVDIGEPLNWDKIDTKGLNVRQMGSLIKSDISNQLTISKVGIMDYSRYPSCLGKSSAFNAFKAHGVAPLLLNDIGRKSDDIISGVNYFTPKDLETLKSNRTIARMAHTNYAHYQTHNKEQWVKLIKDLIIN